MLGADRSVPPTRKQVAAEIDALEKELRNFGLVVPVVYETRPSVLDLKEREVDYAYFVVDTSGSMRESLSGNLRPEVLRRFALLLNSTAGLKGLLVVSSSGETICRWDRKDADLGMSGIRDLVQELLAYSVGSESGWDAGLQKAVTLSLERPDDERVEITIFGDEYHGELKTYYKVARVCEGARARRGLSVNVVRAREPWYDRTRVQKRGSEFWENNLHFEVYGRHLARALGGSFYDVRTYDSSEMWEVAALKQLRHLYPEEVWAVSLEKEKIESLNELLRRELNIERDCLVSMENGERRAEVSAIVELFLDETASGDRYCRMARRLPDESEIGEYRGKLSYRGDVVVIEDWIALWRYAE